MCTNWNRRAPGGYNSSTIPQHLWGGQEAKASEYGIPAYELCEGIPAYEAAGLPTRPAKSRLSISVTR